MTHARERELTTAYWGIDAGMSPSDLFVWGTDNVAYITRVDADPTPVFALCSASGGVIAYTCSHDEALKRALDAELRVVDVH